MANIKSAKKRVKTNEKRRQLNIARRSELKTASKKVLTAIEDGKVEEAQELMRDAEAKISRAEGKGLLKKNTASRKISRLAKKVAVAKKGDK
jgi:small subunit ribosomal protein S20